MSGNFDPLLDAPQIGAPACARGAGFINEKTGKPDLRRFYYAAERGYVDVDKMGRKYISTLRRLTARARGTAA